MSQLSFGSNIEDHEESDVFCPIRIEIGVINSCRPEHSILKLETTIADILSKFDCLKRTVSKAPFHSSNRNHSTPSSATNKTDSRVFDRDRRGSGKPSNEWRSSSRPADSWSNVASAALGCQPTDASAKRPRIGVSMDPGLRAITSLLNKINESNFETIKSQVVKLVSDGSVQVKSAIDALLEKSATDGDGFTLAYAKLLASVATSTSDNNSHSAAALRRISEFLQEIYGSGDDLWNEIASVADATVRFKPTDNYDGFCAAIKAKKKIFGRHRTALSILTLMGKDVSGVPKPVDAVSKLISLMKRAVSLGSSDDSTPITRTYYHCLADEKEEEEEEHTNMIVEIDRMPIREAAIEIVLELVYQLSTSLVMVKKEAFASGLSSLKSGMSAILTDDIISSCGSQCRFRAESVLDKLAEFTKSAMNRHLSAAGPKVQLWQSLPSGGAAPKNPVLVRSITTASIREAQAHHRPSGKAADAPRREATKADKAWQSLSSGDAVKAALQPKSVGRTSAAPPEGRLCQSVPFGQAAPPVKSGGSSWRSIVESRR
jgi:hypothetical protein